MAKLYEIDFRKGTLIDFIGKTIGTLTIGDGGFKNTDKGKAMYLDGSATKLATGLSPEWTGNITLECWVKPKTTALGRVLLGSNSILLGITSGGAFYFSRNDSTTSLSDTNNFEKWYHVIVTSTNAGVTNLYINGNLSGSADQSAGTPTAGNELVIGFDDAKYCYGYIAKVVFYDKIITNVEIQNLYTKFIKSFSLKHSKIKRTYLKPDDLSRENGILNAYNFIPNGQTLADISGNKNNGDIVGVATTENGMVFKDTGEAADVNLINLDSNIDFPVKTGQCTIAFYAKKTRNSGSSADSFMGFTSTDGRQYITIYNNTSELVIETNTNGDEARGDLDSNNVGWNSYVITANEGTIKMYQNGVALNMTDDTVMNDMSLNRFGRRDATSAFDGIFADFRCYNVEWGITEIKNYHNKWAKQISLYEDFRYENADGNTLIPKDWVLHAGSYKIGEITAKDSVLDEIDVGVKYLESVTTGYIAIPQNEGFGTFEFCFYTVSGEKLYIYFTCDKPYIDASQQGYIIGMQPSGVIRLAVDQIGSVRWATANDYISNETWYKIKVTATPDGVRTTWIKGGSFGKEYVLVSTVGGSGSNPDTNTTRTASKYLIFENFTAGLRITKIKKTKGVIV